MRSGAGQPFRRDCCSHKAWLSINRVSVVGAGTTKKRELSIVPALDRSARKTVESLRVGCELNSSRPRGLFDSETIRGRLPQHDEQSARATQAASGYRRRSTYPRLALHRAADWDCVYIHARRYA